MTLLRASVLILAVPLLSACIVVGGKTESSTGTTLYPPTEAAPEAPGSYGTGVAPPTGQAARVYYDAVEDPYRQAVLCAASQTALLDMNTYMVTRQNLYDMQDSIWMWTELAVERGAERGITEDQTHAAIARAAQGLKGREANRIALGCVNTAD